MASILCTAPQNGLAEGDQFLDSIGETALIARYVLDGNLEDASRNSLHALAEGGSAQYAEDELFGQVLDLSNGAYLNMPGQALSTAESLSVTAWVKLNEKSINASLFDLGTDSSHRFACVSFGKDRQNGCSVELNGGPGKQHKISGFRPRPEQWTHLAVVLDTASQTLSLYINGKQVSLTENVPTEMEDFLGAPSKNRLLIGGSADGKALNGQLHDVRFYRTALTERQVAVIHHNAISEEQWGGNDDSAQEISYREDRARQLSVDLIGVKNVTVKTAKGMLPELPYYVEGQYKNGAEGPKVRVLWPAPKDNSSVQKTGIYTITGSVPGTDFAPTATVQVVNSIKATYAEKATLEPFALGQVTLTPDAAGHATPFMKHRDKFLKGLAASNPDTFLYNFRDAFGEPQPDGTTPLYGWDSQDCRLRGHASGHYLTAIAQACASTSYDPELHALFEERMNYMIDVLYDLSQRSGKPAKRGGDCEANPTQVPPGPNKSGFDSDLSKDGIRTDYWNWGEGFISGYPPDQFIMLEHGASYGADNSRIWAPYYTLHKILAGLMDCYEVGGNPKALEIAKGMGLWVYVRLDALPQETLIKMWNSYIAGEYGGMNEAMARLSRLTGDERFLECAKLFDNTEFFFGDAEHHHGLACNVDTIRGRHANQHIPQITGALETYKITHNPAYFAVADHFWNLCTHSYMHSIGGVAGARNPNNAECFTAEPDTLFRNGISDGGQNETCATYNLLKLGRQLFMFDLDGGYMDYYERALYNHILASVAEHDAGNTYHVPLNPGAVKSFGNAEMNGFTCCNGTALESATKLQDTIYLKQSDNSELHVNLYIPSVLDWKERNVKITQTTSYPYSDTIKLTINGSGAFALNLRIPNWVSGDAELMFNGKAAKVEAVPGSYLKLKRKWKNGDTLELRLPMNFHLMPLMDQPNVASIFYGPVLLAAEEQTARTSWRKLELDMNDLDSAFTGDPSTLRFQSGSTRFKPFFETYGRHSVYLEIVPKESKDYPPITAIDPPEQEFFAKQLDFHGIPIKASAAVVDEAFYEACDRLSMMLEHRPDSLTSLAKAGAELHIIGRNEVTTDLPDYRDMKGVPVPEYGGLTYDERTRGFGGLHTSCGEENLLRLKEDRYFSSDICVHEFAHNVMYYGMPKTVAEEFAKQRDRSLANGLWVDSYAGSNTQEFFAELSMWYFGTHGSTAMKGEPPAVGRDGLKAYDPEAYVLFDAFWSGRLSN